MAAITLHESAERTASGDGDAVDISPRNAAKLVLRVTAVDGTAPKVTATVQTSPDGSTGWRTVGQIIRSSIGKSRLVVIDLDDYLRVTWAIGGSASPSVTFSLEGESRTVFATRDDIVNGDIKEAGLANVPANAITEALFDASSDAEDLLATSNAMPITAWPDSLKRRVATLAAYQIMTTEGFRPTGFDEIFAAKYEAACKWFEMVAAGKIRPPGLSPATELGPQTSSGNPTYPTRFRKRMSDNWGDFG